MTDIVWSLKAAASHPDAGPGTCRVLIAEVLEAVAEIERLRTVLASIDEQFWQAAQDDCENGVRWLNESAASKYLSEYPHTKAAISFAHKAVRVALEEK